MLLYTCYLRYNKLQHTYTGQDTMQVLLPMYVVLLLYVNACQLIAYQERCIRRCLRICIVGNTGQALILIFMRQHINMCTPVHHGKVYYIIHIKYGQTYLRHTTCKRITVILCNMDLLLYVFIRRLRYYTERCITLTGVTFFVQHVHNAYPQHTLQYG